ncbi:MAG: hypothetical protein ACOY3L_09740 [Pseudomonadota bacterium]
MATTSLLACLALDGVAAAQQLATAASNEDIAATLRQQQKMIEEQARKLEEQARLLAQQQRQLQEQQKQLEELARQREIPAILPATMSMPELGDDGFLHNRVQEIVPVPPETGEGQPAQPGQPSAQEEERPASEKPTEQLLLERGGVLLPEGTLQLEPSLEYTHISSNQVSISGFTIFDAIVIGNISVDELNRDIVTAAATARYGLTDRIQVEARVPFVYRQDSTLFGKGTADQIEVTHDGYGIGDVEFSSSYQPIIGSGGALPDVILRSKVRLPTGKSAFDIDTESVGTNRTVLKEAPTGSGFYGVGVGATFVWRVDPVVFFSGGNITVNLPRSYNVGDVDPGDVFEFFGGVNVSLSELVSINLSFDDQITSITTVDGDAVTGTSTNDARLILGTAVGVGGNTTLTFNASAGLTSESPDFAFTIALPITFSSVSELF